MPAAFHSRSINPPQLIANDALLLYYAACGVTTCRMHPAANPWKVMNSMYVRCFYLLLFLMTLCFSAAPARAGDEAENASEARQERISALEVFRILPLTIFENTLEGLSEDEKERLLSYGKSEYWILLPTAGDSLELVSLPFGDTHVFLHVYHEEDGSVLAVVGAGSDDICTLEIWRMRAGDFLPVAAPPEPPVSDFFAKGNKMPKDVQASILFCPDAEGLEALAVFWNEQGKAHVPVDNELRYVWNGKNFEKRLRPKVQH